MDELRLAHKSLLEQREKLNEREAEIVWETVNPITPELVCNFKRGLTKALRHLWHL